MDNHSRNIKQLVFDTGFNAYEISIIEQEDYHLN